MYIDEEIPVILCLDDIHKSTATNSISTNAIAIIQLDSEESQPNIIELLKSQEQNTFENIMVQLVDSPSNIVFDNLESQEQNTFENTTVQLVDSPSDIVFDNLE